MAHDPAGAVYGAALFEAALASGALDQASVTLTELGAAIAGEPGLASALFNPAFPDAGKKQILTQLAAGAQPVVRNSLLLLVDNGRLEALPDVIAEFDRRYQETKRQIELELTTAVPIAVVMSQPTPRLRSPAITPMSRRAGMMLRPCSSASRAAPSR